MNPDSMFGDMHNAFLDLLRLESLEDMVFAHNLMGASRLLSLPPFEPISAITIAYQPDSVEVHLAISEDDAWEKIACGDTESSSPAVSRTASMPTKTLPDLLSGWPELRATLADAGNCISTNEQAGPHIHFAYGEGHESRYTWFNPHPDSNSIQCALIAAYESVKNSAP